MNEVWPFLKALIKHLWAMMSCALFTVLSIYAAATNRTSIWVTGVSVTMAVLCLLVAAFLAWREEYLKGTGGPEILMDWEIHEHGYDTVRLRNVGKEVALNVSVGEFSWDALRDALFTRDLGPNSFEVGYLLDILRLRERPDALRDSSASSKRSGEI